MSDALKSHEAVRAIDAIARARQEAKIYGFEVPAWVPEKLICEFVDCAKQHGEGRAAGYIRKRKAEMGERT